MLAVVMIMMLLLGKTDSWQGKHVLCLLSQELLTSQYPHSSMQDVSPAADQLPQGLLLALLASLAVCSCSAGLIESFCTQHARH